MSRKRVVTAVCLTFLGGAANTASPAGASGPAIKETCRNSIVFDHCGLKFVSSDACDTPESLPTLKLGHGDWFQVRFLHTDPRRFQHTVTALTDSELKTATAVTGKVVSTDVLSERTLVMQHDRHFRQYRLSIRATAPSPAEGETPGEGSRGVAPGGTGRKECDGPPYALYEVEQDFGVETHDWEVTFSGGLAFTGLVSPKYYAVNDDKGTADKADDVLLVRRDHDAQDGFRPDVLALANLSKPGTGFWGKVGLAFGFGIGDDANPRYYFGPSFAVGRSFILTAGWAGGKVATLPTGQRVDSPARNGASTLQDLPTRFNHTFFTGIAFTFANREKEFMGKLSASGKATEPPAEAPKGSVELQVPIVEKATAGAKVTVNGHVKGVRVSAAHTLIVTRFLGGTGDIHTLNPLGADGAFQLTFADLSKGKHDLSFVLKEGETAVTLTNPSQSLVVPDLK